VPALPPPSTDAAPLVNPYAAPEAELPAPPAPPAASATGALHVMIALSLLVVSWSLAVGLNSILLGALGFVGAVVVAVLGLIKSTGALGASAFLGLRLGVKGTCLALFGLVGNGLLLLMGAGLTLLATFGFSRGRQLRRFGRVMLPRLEQDGRWTAVRLSPEISAPERAGVAAQWRENGRTEHASVAAFARLTLDLMGLGAPPALIAASNRDALDEIRHTELCYSLARSLDGQAVSPAAFPEAARAKTLPKNRTLALATLAVDSLVDGALHEGVSARVIAKLAKRCEDPAIRAVLKEIAADEGRHAAHGWDVVEWCLAEGGAPVASALEGALRTLPGEVHGDLPRDAEDGSWERFGIHGRALEAAELAKTRADLVARVRAMIQGTRAAA
jgi:hypothetical protein